MNKLEFLVKGSADEPYKVVFTKEEDSLKASCNCKAAVNGMHCKHRINILKGEVKSVVSDNVDRVNTVVEWLKNTELEKALSDYLHAEKTAEKAKRQLAKAKKNLIKYIN